jgi:hypothetical protein
MATNDEFGTVNNGTGQGTNGNPDGTPVGADDQSGVGLEEDAETPGLADLSGTGGGLSSGVSSGLFGASVAGAALDEVESEGDRGSPDEDVEEFRGNKD